MAADHKLPRVVFYNESPPLKKPKREIFFNLENSSVSSQLWRILCFSQLRFCFGSSDPIQCSGNGICPAYMLQYGSWSTSGLLLSETLDFDEGDATDFVVGCSIISSQSIEVNCDRVDGGGGRVLKEV
ncbi:hypothetical protein L1887_28216 [Cichorium endivia]|nr:hypothetical protein L1887_28216 [Cichorium endivia]